MRTNPLLLVRALFVAAGAIAGGAEKRERTVILVNIDGLAD